MSCGDKICKVYDEVKILTLHRVRSGDDFIGKLWDTHLRVKKEGYTQVCALQIRLG